MYNIYTQNLFLNIWRMKKLELGVFAFWTLLLLWIWGSVSAECDYGEIDLNWVCGSIEEWVWPNYIDIYGESFDMWSITITRWDETIQILDRDLGAIEKSEWSDWYWYKFQWWNNFWFSAYWAYYTHLWSSVDTLGLWYSRQNPYISHFFGDFSTDWSSSANDELWWNEGIGEYSMQGPCPEWTHIPTKEELEKLSLWMSWSANNMNNLLYMPFAGYRNWAESIPWLWSTAYYRSSSPSGINSYSLVAPQNGDISITPNERAKAASVRCFFDEPWYIVLSYDTMWWSLMQWQTVQFWEKAHVPWYDPQKDNAILEGWYKDSSYSEKFLFSGESDWLDIDTTIYAKWKCAEWYALDGDECVKAHKVIFNSMGWTKVDPQTVISGNAIDYIVPTMTWADFLWWYYTQYYAIDVNDTRFPQWCNTEWLPNPDEYCVLSTPVKSRSFSGYFYVAPFTTEVVKNAKMADYYCKNNIFIWDVEWDLPLSRWYMVGTERAYLWTVMKNNRWKTFNFNAQWSGKPNHYWAWYSNPTESQNCILSAMCGRENTNTRISSRCVTTSETPIDLPNAPSELIWEYLEWDIIEWTTILDARWSCKPWYVMENGICRWYEILFDAKWGNFSWWYNQNVVEYVINDEWRYDPTSPVETPTKAWTDIFLWWYKDSALTQPFVMYPNGVELEWDITLYAKYGAEPVLYNVSFVDENWVELWSWEIYSGSFLSWYNIPEKYWYNALWWYESWVDTTTGWQFNTDVVTKDLVLYPQYELKTYHVSYVDENGTELRSWEVQHGSYLSWMDMPLNDWYRWLWWYQTWWSDSMRNFDVNIVDWDLVLYPRYERINNWWGWWSNGRSWWWSKKDKCSNWDNSPSYYDGLCEDQPHNVASDEIDKSDNIKSKKIAELEQAYKFAYDNWFITWDSIDQADLSWNLTRIEMAKMLSKFAVNIMWMNPDKNRVNKFRDVDNQLDYNYNSWVELSYWLWIMWINMPNNEFRPFDLVPKAESATALSRLFYRTSDGEYENTSGYYTHHVEKLEAEWVMTNIDPDMIELKSNVILILMKSVLK